MKRIVSIITCIFISGCASPYYSPNDYDTAEIRIVLKKPLKLYTAVSVFDGLECASSPYGEYVGLIGKEVTTAELTTAELKFKVVSDRVVSMELFERFKYTAIVVSRGEYCKNLIAFTPERGASYLLEYWPGCKYSLVNITRNKKVSVQRPTGKCHSGYIFGAYK